MKELKSRTRNIGRNSLHFLYKKWFCLKEELKKIRKFDSHHSFIYPLDVIWTQIEADEVTGKKLKKERDRDRKFTELLKKEYSQYEIWAVDGSKEDCSVEAAVTNLDKSRQSLIQLPDFCSSYFAEIVAIHKALEMIEESAYNYNLICTDSLSAVNQLNADYLKPDSYPEIFEIKHKIIELRRENIIVKIIYIPAHVGITINEEVDELAKLARVEGELYEEKVFWNEWLPD